MHIRKLDLQGFKSFPDRTSFHFAPGVSGVVGPNGCGKSNVVDAVKWCMGEQSAKSLRGRSMEDIIFSGADGRNALGMTEVTLTFASGGEPFAGEFARCEEIQITRRLFRDGHSEYLINQNRCRLKDVHDLFRDTGAGNRLYSFIEQGRIGEIVKARPEDRRTLIEEAAGISRYKARKREAEQRLDGTNRNLERATDLVEDLSSRLRSLRRQVAKATRYRRLRTEVRQGEIYLGLARFSGLVGDRRALTERLRAAVAEEQTRKKDLVRLEEGIFSEREAVDLLETGVGRRRDRLAELEATRREQESARLYQGRESQQLEERIERLTATRTQATSDLSIISEQLERAQQEQTEAGTQVELARTKAEGVIAETDAAEAHLRERRVRIETNKNEVLEIVRQLARDKASQEASRFREEDLEVRANDLAFRVQVARDGIGDHEAECKAAQTLENSAQAALEAASVAATAAEEALQAQDEAVVAARQILRESEVSSLETERSAAQARVRIESLESLQATHEGVEETVLQALGVAGVLGTLADHLDVEASQEALVATALGDELEHVLVPDAATALSVVRSTRGRVGILLVSGTASGDHVLSSIAGSDVGRRAVERLLPDCEQVDDLETAIARHEQDGGAYIVPALDDVLPILVTHRGELRVGPATSGGMELLQRRRRLSELQTQMPQLDAAMTAAAEALTTARSDLSLAVGAKDQGQATMRDARQKQGEARVSHLAARNERARMERQQEERNRHLEQLETDHQTIVTTITQLTNQGAGLSGSIDTALELQTKFEETLKTEQAALAEDEVSARDIRQSAVLARTELAGLEERHRSLAQIADAARQSAEGSSRQLSACTRDIEAATARILELATDDQRLNKVLQGLGEEQGEVRLQIEAGREQVRTARTALREAEESIRVLRDAREEATTRRSAFERDIDQVKTEIIRIREQLDERYQVSVAALLDQLERDGQLVIEVPVEARYIVSDSEAETDPSLPTAKGPELDDLCISPALLENEDMVGEWMERLQVSRGKLERLGEVNLAAIDEYVEVKSKHDALEEQRLDLEESIRSIRNTIAQLNRTCRERFRETFDRVNDRFREGYPRLVGGGTARLVLTDEDDMLETGVDIEVQPPGKRLQNMALLSGGEMAMTAIALIFALFQVKPSPFCLLDEVDAPLDEANGARFNSLLREMAKLSQFIVITHNKKTMESVDTLYGVTMHQPGVSQLVTVRLA